jgi:hypothetical protein
VGVGVGVGVRPRSTWNNAGRSSDLGRGMSQWGWLLLGSSRSSFVYRLTFACSHTFLNGDWVCKE